MKQRLGPARQHGRGEQRVHIDRSCGLAHQCDPAGVASKGANIALHEFQGFHDVEQREVARVGCSIARLQRRKLQKAEDAEPVGDRNDDRASVSRQRGAVVHRIGGVPRNVAAAMHPDDDRPGTGCGRGWRPDVEVEAVLRAQRLAQRAADSGVVPVVQARPI